MSGSTLARAAESLTQEDLEPSPPERTTGDGPWFWQSKTAHNLIIDLFSERSGLPSAIAVYSALARLASDRGSQTYSARKSLISSLSGVGVRTVQSLLKDFAKAGLIEVEERWSETNFQLPNEYTLLSLGNEPSPVSIECSPAGNERSPGSNQRMRTSNADTLKEKKKKLLKEHPLKNGASLPLPFDSPEFKSAWTDWEQSRQEAGKPIKPTTRKLQLSTLKTMGEARAITALIHSATSGYQGLFEPTGERQSKRMNGTPDYSKGW